MTLQRRFQLHRDTDSSGVSGTGVIAEGVQFSNNECAILWLTKRSSIGIYTNISDIQHIHGHGGNTRIVWIDDGPKVTTKEVTEVVTKETAKEVVEPSPPDDEILVVDEDDTESEPIDRGPCPTCNTHPRGALCPLKCGEASP